jgi:hypothetical protein
MGKFIKYVGLAHRRGITSQEWASIGINADSVWWGAENGFAVSADRLTDAQIRKAIEPDKNFIIVGLDEAPDALPHDMTPAQADGPRVDIRGAMDAPEPSTAKSGAFQEPANTNPSAPRAKK